MSLDRKTRVLLVDDSLFMRIAVKRMLEADPRFEVVGEAKDGESGVALVEELRPDVVTMDVNMPVMDGVTAVSEIMRTRPTPVVMLSAHTNESARVTLDALAAGAVDFLAKPSGEVSTDIGDLAEPLRAKLLTAAQAIPQASTRHRARPPRSRPQPSQRPRSSSRMAPSSRRGHTDFPIVVLGVSTGGPSALAQVLPQLPGHTALSLVIVQHMPEHYTGALAERLDGQSDIRVVEAREQEQPRRGVALVAPGGKHLEATAGGVFRLTDGPPVHSCRPSVDVTMRSVAHVFRTRAVGVLMTGMGTDGVDGLAAIRAAGGRTYAQDEASCVVHGMPRAAVVRGVVDDVVRLEDLAHRLHGLGER